VVNNNGHDDETHDELVQQFRDLVERAKAGDMGAAREVLLHALGPPDSRARDVLLSVFGPSQPSAPPSAGDVWPSAFGGRIAAKLDEMGARPDAEAFAKFDARGRAQLQLAGGEDGATLDELADLVEEIAYKRNRAEYQHYADLLRAAAAGDAALFERHARWLAEHGTDLQTEGQVALAVIRDGRDHIGEEHGLQDS